MTPTFHIGTAPCDHFLDLRHATPRCSRQSVPSSSIRPQCLSHFRHFKHLQTRTTSHFCSRALMKPQQATRVPRAKDVSRRHDGRTHVLCPRGSWAATTMAGCSFTAWNYPLHASRFRARCSGLPFKPPSWRKPWAVNVSAFAYVAEDRVDEWVLKKAQVAQTTANGLLVVYKASSWASCETGQRGASRKPNPNQLSLCPRLRKPALVVPVGALAPRRRLERHAFLGAFSRRVVKKEVSPKCILGGNELEAAVDRDENSSQQFAIRFALQTSLLAPSLPPLSFLGSRRKTAFPQASIGPDSHPHPALSEPRLTTLLPSGPSFHSMSSPCPSDPFGSLRIPSDPFGSLRSLGLLVPGFSIRPTCLAFGLAIGGEDQLALHGHLHHEGRRQPPPKVQPLLKADLRPTKDRKTTPQKTTLKRKK